MVLFSNQQSSLGPRGRTCQGQGPGSLEGFKLAGQERSQLSRSRWIYTSSHPSSNSTCGYEFLFLLERTPKSLGLVCRSEPQQYEAGALCWVWVWSPSVLETKDSHSCVQAVLAVRFSFHPTCPSLSFPPATAQTPFRRQESRFVLISLLKPGSPDTLDLFSACSDLCGFSLTLVLDAS